MSESNEIINLNTPELISYNEAVDFNAIRKRNFIFNNTGKEKALIVFRSIFRSANKFIKIVALNLDNIVTTHQEYISALESFLSKPDSKLEILLSEKPNLENKLFTMLSSYREKISVRIMEGCKTFKDSQGRTIHFCIADGQMYRLEYDIKERKAQINFNDPNECSKLNNLFISVFNNNSTSICV